MITILNYFMIQEIFINIKTFREKERKPSFIFAKRYAKKPVTLRKHRTKIKFFQESLLVNQIVNSNFPVWKPIFPICNC